MAFIINLDFSEPHSLKVQFKNKRKKIYLNFRGVVLIDKD